MYSCVSLWSERKESHLVFANKYWIQPIEHKSSILPFKPLGGKRETDSEGERGIWNMVLVKATQNTDCNSAMAEKRAKQGHSFLSSFAHICSHLFKCRNLRPFEMPQDMPLASLCHLRKLHFLHRSWTISDTELDLLNTQGCLGWFKAPRGGKLKWSRKKNFPSHTDNSLWARHLIDYWLLAPKCFFGGL